MMDGLKYLDRVKAIHTRHIAVHEALMGRARLERDDRKVKRLSQGYLAAQFSGLEQSIWSLGFWCDPGISTGTED